MIHRRFILQRDPPYDFKEALSAIRRLSGWGSSDLAFILNVPRQTLTRWEGGSDPRYDDGRAIITLLQICRNCGTPDEQAAA